jgi:hypothetical protein
MAVGALAIGALAIGRIRVLEARIERLSIGTLTVDQFNVLSREEEHQWHQNPRWGSPLKGRSRLSLDCGGDR